MANGAQRNPELAPFLGMLQIELMLESAGLGALGRAIYP